MRLRFTVRELFWLTLAVAAIAASTWLSYRNASLLSDRLNRDEEVLTRLHDQLDRLKSENDAYIRNFAFPNGLDKPHLDVPEDSEH
jgi:hypothetical protein